MTKWLATSLVVAAALTAPAAQSLDPISAEDILNVRTANVLDLSDDGRRVAIGVRRLADNATTDHRRYGDPTYFAPSMVELMVTSRAYRQSSLPAPVAIELAAPPPSPINMAGPPSTTSLSPGLMTPLRTWLARMLPRPPASMMGLW